MHCDVTALIASACLQQTGLAKRAAAAAAAGTSQVQPSHDPWAVTLMRARGHRGHPGPERSFSPLKISRDVAEFAAVQ